MIFLQGLGQGIAQLWTHKVRSLLSIACVALGVASFIVVSGLIEGMFSGWQTAITRIGGLQKLTVENRSLPAKQRHLAGASRGRTMEDAKALERLAAFSGLVSPELEVRQPIVRKGRSYYGEVRGVLPVALEANDLAMGSGRFIGDVDERDGLPVIVLGSDPVEVLFGKNENPIGQHVRIQGQSFTVVGVIERYEKLQFGYNVLGQKNRVAFVPLSAAKQRLTRAKALTNLTMRAHGADMLPQAVDEARNILRQTHRGLSDFGVRTNEDEFAQFETTRRNWFVAGAGIAVISLVVGGIGIMNLMLASIQERMREIGLRKAIGAWNRDIFALFVAEAVSLTLVGGGLGILAGQGIIFGLGILMAKLSPPVFSMTSALTGLVFSVATGLFAGIYPALEAARMDPIEALRQE